MSESNRFDLIVVGAGLAGMIAANRAAELGLSVAVLERGEDERHLCNSRLTGGFFHVAMNSITKSPDHLKTVIRDVTAGACDPGLCDTLAQRAGATVKWMSSRGVRFIRGGALDWMDRVLAPPGMRKPGLHWEGRGGDVLLRDMAGWLTRAGGHLLRGHSAKSLRVEDARVLGLTAERADGSLVEFTGAVLLADGGFQGDRELMRRHISPNPDALLQRGAGTGRGDGLRLAISVGAKCVGLDRFYGHVQCSEARSSTKLWPYPILDLVCAASIVINGQGQRFTDEGLGGIPIANAVARLEDPLSAAVIFDSAIWQGVGREYILPPNPAATEGGAKLISAGSLKDLAQVVGVPAGALEASVADYNAALARNATSTLDRPRTAKLYTPHPIIAPPYHALRLCAGITYTMGGIMTDALGRVLSETGGRIAGLYAAGSTTGGLEGGPGGGYTGGLAKAATFGFAAAEAARADLGNARLARP